MGPFGNAILGFSFLVFGGAATLLMYRLWGYPFDHATLKSEAPPGLTRLHRLLGYAYAALYLVLMIQMLPRLWSYQIELPARTVLHLALGIAVGAALIVKVLIVRFFKHLESTFAPLLGTGLLVSTVVLIGLSAPVAIREAYVSRGSTRLDAASRKWVQEQLVQAGLDAPADQLTSPDGLAAGRSVLSTKCVGCHDLRTVLARPKAAANWVETVHRMAERASLYSPISKREQQQVAAYLVAISPALQKSALRQRDQDRRQAQAQQAVQGLGKSAAGAQPGYDPEASRRLFEARCSQCHPHAQVEANPPLSADAVGRLLARMVSNGLAAKPGELEAIGRFLTLKYAK